MNLTKTVCLFLSPVDNVTITDGIADFSQKIGSKKRRIIRFGKEVIHMVRHIRIKYHHSQTDRVLPG